MDTSGVYRIKNLVNNKIYIGSSVTVEKRLLKHKNELLKNIHCNNHLQNAYNKYGLENFIFEKLVDCPRIIKELREMEQYLKDFYQAEYNIRDKVDSNEGMKFSDEHKAKISAAHKGKTLSEETKEKLRIINTGKKASEETLLKRGLIFKGRKQNPEWIEKRASSKRIPIYQFDKASGFIKEFRSIADASRELGIQHINIIKCAKSQRNHAGGFIWKYENVQ